MKQTILDAKELLTDVRDRMSLWTAYRLEAVGASGRALAHNCHAALMECAIAIEDEIRRCEASL